MVNLCFKGRESELDAAYLDLLNLKRSSSKFNEVNFGMRGNISGSRMLVRLGSEDQV